MPCSDGGVPYEGRYEWEQRLRHDSPTAEALCELCQYMETNSQYITPGAARWWAEHKHRDRIRVEAQLDRERDAKARAEAIEKLTPYERRLLGIS